MAECPIRAVCFLNRIKRQGGARPLKTETSPAREDEEEDTSSRAGE